MRIPDHVDREHTRLRQHDVHRGAAGHGRAGRHALRDDLGDELRPAGDQLLQRNEVERDLSDADAVAGNLRGLGGLAQLDEDRARSGGRTETGAADSRAAEAVAAAAALAAVSGALSTSPNGSFALNRGSAMVELLLLGLLQAADSRPSEPEPELVEHASDLVRVRPTGSASSRSGPGRATRRRRAGCVGARVDHGAGLRELGEHGRVLVLRRSATRETSWPSTSRIRSTVGRLRQLRQRVCRGDAEEVGHATPAA